MVDVALAPGESLLPGTRERLEALFAARAEVEAVLVPLVPQGDTALPRAARRYLAAWDARFLHPQNYFAPAARVAFRADPDAGAPPRAWRNADAAPILARALADGRRIEALREGGAACRIADDLGAWTRHFREEGAAWGALAARDASYARFLAPRWWHAHRRAGEILEAIRRPDPLVVALHLAREAAFGRAASVPQRSSSHPPG